MAEQDALSIDANIFSTLNIDSMYFYLQQKIELGQQITDLIPLSHLLHYIKTIIKSIVNSSM